MKRAGWKRLSSPGDKLAARWVFTNGWEVRHCGHPTAIWPYFVVAKGHEGRIVSDRSGRGFGTLVKAFEAVEAVVEGRRELFDDGPTKHGYRMVIADPQDLPAWLRNVIEQRA